MRVKAKFSLIIICCLSTIIVFVLYVLFINHYISSLIERGQFGDMFGALNTFFSGLALIGVIYTVSQQNEIIKNNTTEFDQRIKEFESQQKIQTLNTLISIYQQKYNEVKSNHLESNVYKKKIIELTNELETYLKQ
jgi:hypothetical protein